jgi:peptidoglycan/LPS O-acetylase OafA/YrhL
VPTVATPRLYFPAVDGLRGAAVLSVLLYHTSWFANGLFGVDIFMVLSGFLITLLLFREATTTGRISLSGFYRRRFKRLMPGLSITLLATLALTYVLGGVEEARQVGAKAVAALFQVANWQQIADHNAYWEGFGKLSPLAHMWSLSITEQFYLAWPLLFVALFWLCRRSVAAVTAVMFVLLAGTAAVAPLLYDGTNSDRLYLGTETRTVDFVAGAAAAGVVFLLHHRRSRRGGHTRGSHGAGALLVTIVGITALAAIITASVLTSSYHQPWLYQGGMAAVAVVTAILVASLCHDRGPLIRVFSCGPLAEIGRISYTLYLLHLPIFWVMQQVMPTIAPYALFIVGGGITWLASMVLHYAVTEKLRLRPWRSLRAIPTATVAASVIILAGYALPTAVAHRLNPGDRPAVLLLGDSLSGNLAEALTGHSNRFAVVDGSISGCGVMASDAVRSASGVVWPTSKECKIRDRLWHNYLRTARYEAVVAHFGWDAADQSVGGRWLSPCDPVYRGQYLAKLDLAAQQVHAAVPNVPFLLMNERTNNGAATPQALLCYNAVINEFVATGKAQLLDLNAIFCPPTSGCRKTDPNGRRLYIDGVHLSPEGQTFVAPHLETKIAEASAARASTPTGAQPQK